VAPIAGYMTISGSEEGVVFIGKAQENTPVFRTERRRTAKPVGPILTAQIDVTLRQTLLATKLDTFTPSGIREAGLERF